MDGRETKEVHKGVQGGGRAAAGEKREERPRDREGSGDRHRPDLPLASAACPGGSGRGYGRFPGNGKPRDEELASCAGRTRICAKSETSCEKQWPSSHDPRNEVSVHGGATGCPQRGEDGQGAGGLTQWVPCLAGSAGEPAPGGRGRTDRADPRDPEGGQAAIRQSAGDGGAAEGRPTGRTQPGGEDHEEKRPAGAAQEAISGHDQGFREPPCSRQRAGEELCGRQGEYGMGERHHLHRHHRGVVVPGRGDGPVLPAGGGLVDELAAEHGPGPEGVLDGGAGTPTAEGVGVSLRPRLAVRQPCVPRGAAARRGDPEHEPQGGLLGQRAQRIVLQHAEDRVDGRRQGVHEPSGREGGDL